MHTNIYMSITPTIYSKYLSSNNFKYFFNKTTQNKNYSVSLRVLWKHLLINN